jgi:release factor glutamine methyltransferase
LEKWAAFAQGGLANRQPPLSSSRPFFAKDGFFCIITKMKKIFNQPLEYARGSTNFLGCKIDLSKRPLIPRPETEFWVGKTIKSLRQNFDDRQNSAARVLDIFCGSGCIGLAVQKHIKNSKVTFADKYQFLPDAIKSDVFSNVRGKFDFIFANPPYVAIKNKNKVQKSVLDFEPRNALFAGQDGLFYIKKFLRDAKKYLNPNGIIFMEFSPEQKKAIEILLKKYKYKNWEFHKDQFGKLRWLACE